MLLSRLLRRLIVMGELTVIDASGATHSFKGLEDGPALTIRLHDRRLHRRLFFQPELALGEAYMDGLLTVENATLYDFVDLLGMNLARTGRAVLQRPKSWFHRLMRRFHQFNPVGWARANVAHHYDLSGALYDLFLDADRQYSCAYFPRGDEDLETAQLLKKRHIAAKMLVDRGHKVLDIGSGWGGMGLYLARTVGADVTGLTLSREQLRLSNERAQEAGLADQARFIFQDYRETQGTFDRIVSVGMFEHVGLDHYRQFFTVLRDRLAQDGVALLHTIGRIDGPGATDPWIHKHIFPGGYCPALSEVTAAIEKCGLWVTDVEILRLHYATTLRHWRQRFLARRDEAKALYDERFCRMWEYYLAVSEVAFRHLGSVVFQIQIARNQEAVPLTRDYIPGAEGRLAELERRRPQQVA